MDQEPEETVWERQVLEDYAPGRPTNAVSNHADLGTLFDRKNPIVTLELRKERSKALQELLLADLASEGYDPSQDISTACVFGLSWTVAVPPPFLNPGRTKREQRRYRVHMRWEHAKAYLLRRWIWGVRMPFWRYLSDNPGTLLARWWRRTFYKGLETPNPGLSRYDLYVTLLDEMRLAGVTDADMPWPVEDPIEDVPRFDMNLV